MNDIPDATTVAFLKRYLRDQGLEPVADKSMMPHWFLTLNGVKAKDNFHSGCSKGLWVLVALKRLTPIAMAIKIVFALKRSLV